MKETIEEAAEKRIPTSSKVWDLTETRRNDFIAGALYQQEQDKKMYSEEEVRDAYRWGTLVNQGTKEHFNEFIKQFKQQIT
jgi:phage terminase large subunit-like protein